MPQVSSLAKAKRLIEAADDLADVILVGRRDFIIDPIILQISQVVRKMLLSQKRITLRLLDELSVSDADLFAMQNLLFDQVFGPVADITEVALAAGLEKAYLAGYNSAAKEIVGAVIKPKEARLKETFNPRAKEWARRHAAELVANINAITRKQINKLVTWAVGKGWSYGRLASAIKAKYNDMAVPRPQLHIPDRATLIAVTETANAYEQGSKQLYDFLDEQGVGMMKRWIAVGDERVCPTCSSNWNMGYIEYYMPFPSGNDAPPAHPACRCTVSVRPLDWTLLGDKGATYY